MSTTTAQATAADSRNLEKSQHIGAVTGGAAPAGDSPRITSSRSHPTDVAELATVYNSPPPSQLHWRNLVDEARVALAKYELKEAELNVAAEHLAKAMHMLVEQSGCHHLEEHLQSQLEMQVLNWCGFKSKCYYQYLKDHGSRKK